MDPLASEDDVVARLGRDLTATEAARIDALLSDASAKVRAYTGQDITQATSTTRVRVRQNRIRLPQRPVTAVSAVTDLNAVALTGWTLVGSVVYLDTAVPDQWAWEPRRTAVGFVDVTYTHGYETVPDELIAVVCQIVGRALGNDATQSGITSETLGAYSYSTGTAGAAGPLGLLPDERAVLDSYRRDVGMMYVGQ